MMVASTKLDDTEIHSLLLLNSLLLSSPVDNSILLLSYF